MTDDCSAVGAGSIRFYDNYVPTLEEGDYLINVVQQVNPDPSTQECYPASQVFSVSGPRYSLPPQDVFSVFPPAESIGIFDQFLPHVVLTRRELPWERPVFGIEPATQVPWMALIVVGEGEQIGGQPALLQPTVPNASATRTMAASITASLVFNHPTGDGVLWPGIVQEWYEQDLDSTPVSVIDLSPQAFTTLLPGPADLRYLAHARQVDSSGKADGVLKVTGDGWYSVVVAGRLPAAPADGPGAPGIRSIAHLVSLEGFSRYLEPGSTLPVGTERIRMIALKSWTFTCLSELGESFAQLANGLTSDTFENPKSTSLSLPVTVPGDASQPMIAAATALGRGYVPLSYLTRQGEQTFGWYRGPLSPVPVANFVGAQQEPGDEWQPFGTASAALAYDKNSGVFDLSYGVAWETGRLMALADGAFGVALADWQRKGHRLIDMILERRAQFSQLANLDPENPDPAIEALLLPPIVGYAVTDPFVQYLASQLSGQLIASPATPDPQPPGPSFPPFPPVPTPPANPQTIADLLQESDVQEAVREAGGQELDAIADWLAQRYLLMGVPFEALVPHSGLLPAESVRFYYLDANWLACLIDGAMSIGIASSRDRLYQDLMKDIILDTALSAVQNVRNQLLDRPPSPQPASLDSGAMAGLVLRSTLVSGWPGLEVHAYSGFIVSDGNPVPDLSTEIPPLRFSNLGSDVLLCLWPSVPAVVTIDEPQEGIAFGFEDPPGQGEGYYLYPRSLGSSDYGAPLCESPEDCRYAIDAVASGIIDPTTRLVKISGADGILAKLQTTVPGSPVLQVRDLAIQLVKVPEQAIFAALGEGE